MSGKIKIIFLCYHYIKRSDEFRRIWGHDFSLFKKHIAFYKKNYPPINPGDFFAFLEGKNINLPSKCSIITFDDSLKEQGSIIAPYLEKHNIRAIFNISPCIFKNEPLNAQIAHFSMAYFGIRKFAEQVKSKLSIINKSPDGIEVFLGDFHDIYELSRALKNFLFTELNHEESRKILLSVWREYMERKIPEAFSKIHMSKKDVVDLSDRGHMIGLHSYSHALINDDTFSDKLCDKELRAGKEILKKAIKKEVNCFSYSYGFFKDVLHDKKNIVKLNELGFKYLFTIYNNGKFDKNFIGRYSSQSHDSLDILKNKIWEYEISNNQQ